MRGPEPGAVEQPQEQIARRLVERVTSVHSGSPTPFGVAHLDWRIDGEGHPLVHPGDFGTSGLGAAQYPIFQPVV